MYPVTGASGGAMRRPATASEAAPVCPLWAAAHTGQSGVPPTVGRKSIRQLRGAYEAVRPSVECVRRVRVRKHSRRVCDRWSGAQPAGHSGPAVYRRTYLGRESPPSWRCASRATGACGWCGAAGSRAACCTAAPRPRLRGSTRPAHRATVGTVASTDGRQPQTQKQTCADSGSVRAVPTGRLRPLPHTAAVLRRYCIGAHRHCVLLPARTRPHVAQTRPPPAQALTVHGNGPRTAGS
jgi:hypothetical protein